MARLHVVHNSRHITIDEEWDYKTVCDTGAVTLALGDTLEGVDWIVLSRAKVGELKRAINAVLNDG